MEFINIFYAVYEYNISKIIRCLMQYYDLYMQLAVK